MDEGRRPEELSDDERQWLHRTHQGLRNASQALEALTVIEPVRGRWKPTPAPPEALEAARAELHAAYREVWRAMGELFAWTPPDDPAER